MKKIMLLVATILWLISIHTTNGNLAATNITTTNSSVTTHMTLVTSITPSPQRPKSEVQRLLDRMKMTFPEVAIKTNTSLPELLRRTWFQIVGTTPDRLKTIGFLDALPLPPSDSLIRLLDSTSIAQLEVSHACIKNNPPLTGKNYTYPLLEFLFMALKLDTQKQTVKVLNALPVGGQSIARFFKTSDALLKKQRYLTDVYPKIKAVIQPIVQSTSEAFYKMSPLEELSYSDYQQFVGQSEVKRIDSIRLKHAKAKIEGKSQSVGSYEQDIASARSSVLFAKWTMLYSALMTPLKSSSMACGVRIVSNHSISEVLQRCINVSRDFELQNMYFIRNPALLKGITIGGIASYLNLSVKSLSRYSMAEILNMSANAETNAAVSIVIPAFKNSIALKELDSQNLLDIGSRIRMIPYPRYLSDASINASLKKITVKELPEKLSKKLSKKVPLNWIRITPYAYLLDVFVKPKLGAEMIKNMYKGLKYMWNNVSIGTTMQVLEIKEKIAGHLTLVTFGNMISGISHADLITMFKIEKSQENLLNSANFDDIRVLLSYNGAKKRLEDFTPALLEKWLFSMPQSSKNLLKTLEEIAKSRGTGLARMTLYNAQSFGPWSDIDMINLLQAVSVPRKYYDKVKRCHLSDLSRIIQTPLDRLGNFNFIKVIKALCTSKQRFNGHTCVHFSGCSSLPTSVCPANAQCVDIIGSYYCRCKSGYVGDGRNCKVQVKDQGNDKGKSAGKSSGFGKTWWHIVLIVVGIIAALAGIFCIYKCCC